MLDMGSEGPTRYFAHAVVWNNRRRVVSRSVVVAARDIPDLASDRRSGKRVSETTNRPRHLQNAHQLYCARVIFEALRHD